MNVKKSFKISGAVILAAGMITLTGGCRLNTPYFGGDTSVRNAMVQNEPKPVYNLRIATDKWVYNYPIRSELPASIDIRTDKENIIYRTQIPKDVVLETLALDIESKTGMDIKMMCLENLYEDIKLRAESCVKVD